jgi:phage shock protein C
VNRRLYRCRENRVIAGVASGVAEFFGLDATLVRVLWFLSIFFGGVTILVYIGLAIIMPLEPVSAEVLAAPAATEPHRHGTGGGGRWITFFGIALMLLGGLALIGALLPSVATWRYLGPLFVIGMGAVLVIGAVWRNDSAPTPAPAAPASPPPSLPQEPTQS